MSLKDIRNYRYLRVQSGSGSFVYYSPLSITLIRPTNATDAHTLLIIAWLTCYHLYYSWLLFYYGLLDSHRLPTG